MKVGIIGAGSIGQLLFHDLRLSDDVNPVFIDTRLPADALGTSFIFECCREADPSEKSYETTLEKHDEKKAVREAYQGMVFPGEKAADQDLIIISVKANQCGKVLQSLKGYLPEHIPLVLLMNGMGIWEEARTILPNPFWTGVTSRGAVHEGRIVYPRGNGTTYIGSPEHQKPVQEIELLARSIGAIISLRIEEEQLQKLLVNACINPITALHQCKNREIAAAYINEAREIFLEIYPVLKTLGVTVSADSAFDFVLTVAEKTGENYSSMAVDFKKQRPSELDYILGYILKTGERLHKSLPVTKNLYTILKKQEDSFQPPPITSPKFLKETSKSKN
ncbi:ketopantoate reductase family protein [Succinimonas amylolytica]|uniref:ketopantoate reductase family protein n=1 Tax=Succinimonas amylolytica TaxID=83769 RepID=UPI000369D97D|nr:2-dehydropantoate 2-reductase [Succinimonas amylolytica]